MPAKKAEVREFGATGVIMPVRHHVERAAKLIKRWEEGDLSTSDMATVLRRISRHMDAGDVCWCDEPTCCTLHDKHVMPHNGGGCLLR